MTTILIKKKDTAGAPAPGDLTNSSGGTEIAVNTATKRIYTKDSGGNVVELGTNATSSTIDQLTVTTSATLSYGTANGVAYLNGSKVLTTGSALTYNGTTLTAVNNASANSITLSRTTSVARDWALGIDGDGGFRLTDSTGGVVVLSVLPSGVAYLASETELAFKYNNTTEGMRLTSTGLGIGTSSPGKKLDVSGAIRSNGATSENFLCYDGTTTTSLQQNGNYLYFNNNVDSATVGGFMWRTTSSYTERMRLDAAGNLGIGTSSPGAKLDVNGSIRAYGGAYAPSQSVTTLVGQIGGVWSNRIVSGSNSGGSPYLAFQVASDASNGSTESLRLFDGGNVYGTREDSAFSWDSSGRIGFVKKTGSAPFFAAGSAQSFIFSHSNASTDIGNNVSSTSFTERMRLDSSGNLGIGTSSPTNRVDIRKDDSSPSLIVGRNNGTGTLNDFIQGLSFVNGSNATYNAQIYAYQATSYPDALGLGFITQSGSGSRDTRMVINHLGNVGIGTSSPGTKLDVQGTTAVDARVYATDNSTGKAKIYLRGGTSNFSFETDAANGSNYLFENTSGQLAYRYFAGASGYWQWYTAGSERMRIDSSGNVGIGTSSPGAKLHITSNTSSGTRNLLLQLSDGTWYPSGNPTINIGGWSGGGNYISGDIGFSTTGGVGMTFGTSAFAGGTPVTHMILDTSGNLLVGTTSASRSAQLVSQTTSSSKYLYSGYASSTSYSGNVFDAYVGNTTNLTNQVFYAGVNGNGAAFLVYGNGNVVNSNNSYGTLSDVKLKENIVDASPKLHDVMQLQVRNFNLKSDQSRKQIGFVAQELEQVFPGLVDESPDRDEEGNETGEVTKSIKTTVLIPILVKALQELKAEFDAYKASHP